MLSIEIKPIMLGVVMLAIIILGVATANFTHFLVC
jgi:hypothetical protein